MRIVTLYTDHKSPYAYLAKDLAYELAGQFPIVLDVLPYTLDIPKFLGSAELDEGGKVGTEQPLLGFVTHFRRAGSICPVTPQLVGRPVPS